MKRTLICAVGLLAVAGCTGSSSSASPTTLPALSSAPPTVAATTAPASAVPVVTKPPKADTPTPEGAAEFARYWIAELNAAYVAVDPSGIAGISDEECRTCQNYIRSLQRAAAASKHYEGGKLTVREAVAAPPQGGRAVVLLDYSLQALREVDSTGRVLQTVPSEDKGTLQFTLHRAGASWRVLEVLRT